ncbi:MAG: SRPBCC family protein, partial [Actinomycetota bacterium]
MIEIEVSTEIRRPVEEVFEFVKEAENIPKWDHDLLKAEKTTDGPIDKGSRFHIEFEPFMGESQGDGEVIDFEPGRLIELQFHMGKMHPHMLQRFEAVNAGTRFTRLFRMEPEGVLKLAAPMMKRTIRKHNEAA